MMNNICTCCNLDKQTNNEEIIKMRSVICIYYDENKKNLVYNNLQNKLDIINNKNVDIITIEEFKETCNIYSKLYANYYNYDYFSYKSKIEYNINNFILLYNKFENLIDDSFWYDLHPIFYKYGKKYIINLIDEQYIYFINEFPPNIFYIPENILNEKLLQIAFDKISHNILLYIDNAKYNDYIYYILESLDYYMEFNFTYNYIESRIIKFYFDNKENIKCII